MLGLAALTAQTRTAPTLPSTIIIVFCFTMSFTPNVRKDELSAPQDQEQALVSMCVDEFRNIS